jgi:ketosteroid isomerase-like protein
MAAVLALDRTTLSRSSSKRSAPGSHSSLTRRQNDRDIRAARLTATRRHRHRLFDATATAKDGKPYTNTYTWYLRMRDGDIIEATAFFDTIEFTDFWKRVAP